MPDVGAALSGIGGAVDSLFGGLGQLQAAKGYKKAAAFSDLSANISQQATQIQAFQAERDVYRTIGGAKADFGGAGLSMSGGALDVIRDSAQQGALTKQLIQAQGAITTAGYEAEAESYRSMATAAKTAGKGGILGGILKAAATAAPFVLASDDRLKTEAVLIGRRRDGLGIWQFKYNGSDIRFEGVMAREVERIYPWAVTYDGGYAQVDYGRIGVEPRIV